MGPHRLVTRGWKIRGLDLEKAQTKGKSMMSLTFPQRLAAPFLGCPDQGNLFKAVSPLDARLGYPARVFRRLVKFGLKPRLPGSTGSPLPKSSAPSFPEIPCAADPARSAGGTTA